MILLFLVLSCNAEGAVDHKMREVCTSHCCQDTFHSGIRLDKLHSLLTNKTKPQSGNRIVFRILGNSVSAFWTPMWGEVSSLVSDGLGYHVPLELKHLMRKGGSIQGTIFDIHNKLDEWMNETDIIYIHYSKLATTPSVEPAIRKIINHPKKPVLILNRHCKGAEIPSAWHNLNQSDSKFAEFFNLPYIDTCASLEKLLLSRCASDTIAFQDVYSGANGGDGIHYGNNGVSMMVRLMANFLIQVGKDTEGKLNVAEPAVLPNNTYFAAVSSAPDFVTFANSTFDDTLHLTQSDGFEEIVAGKNKKRVLSATRENASFTFTTPPYARWNQLKVEMYVHHDLPMGALEVLVNGETAAIKKGKKKKGKESELHDACCKATGCPEEGQDVALGSGIYKTFHVWGFKPKRDPLYRPLQNVTFIARRNPNSNCQVDGKAVHGFKIDIVSIFGSYKLNKAGVWDPG